MRSGILAADHVAAALAAGRANDELTAYDDAWRGSAIGTDLWKVRNAKPLWSRFGTALGIGLAGADCGPRASACRRSAPCGMASRIARAKAASRCRPIAYPRPDGTLTFDRLSSVFLSNTNHEEDQPVHLHLRDPELQAASEHDIYGGPSRVIARLESMSGCSRTAPGAT